MMSRETNPIERTVTKSALTKRRKYYRNAKRWIKAQLNRDGHFHCAIPNCPGDDLELHHKLPLALGGTNDIDNLMVLCHDHHVEIHNNRWDE